MIKYCKKLGFLASILVLINLGVLVLSAVPRWDRIVATAFHCSEYTNSSWASESRAAITILKEKPTATRAVMGDSVMGQLFNGMDDINPDYCISNGNASFLLIGQWIMLNEYLNQHPNATDVYLILRPWSITEQLNTRYSYQFVIIPFYREPYRSLFTQESRDNISTLFPFIFTQSWFFDFFERSYLVRYLTLNSFETENYAPSIKLSKENQTYLEMMFDVCEERGVSLYLLAAPLADTEENHDMVNSLKNELEASGLLSRMPYYFDSLLYFPAENFGDTVHFTDVTLFKGTVLEHYQHVTGGLENLLYDP